MLSHVHCLFGVVCDRTEVIVSTKMFITSLLTSCSRIECVLFALILSRKPLMSRQFTYVRVGAKEC